MPEFDVVDFIRQLEANGPMADPRPDLDTQSLVRADPALSPVVVTDVSVPGPHGDVPVRVYADPAQPSRSGLVWVHGGGFVGGSLDMPEAHWVSLYIASRGVPVVSVDYQKALRGVRYPVALDEVIATWLWVLGADRPLGARVDRLHFGGASAGANLATAATQRMRDGGLPTPTSLMLAYPLLHAELPPLHADITAALASNPPPVNFTPTVVKAFNANYIGEVAAPATYAFPGDIEVGGLPSVLIVNAEADELRASGELFARQLAHAGVDVVSLTQEGAQHGYLDQPNDVAAIETIDRFLAHINRPS